MPGQVRIRVHVWADLAPIRDAYFAQHGARKVMNYLAAYGVRDTWLRVKSRRAERDRNRKCVAAGLGTVIEAPSAPELLERQVAFVAPIHPESVDEVCLDIGLVRPLNRGGDVPWKPDEIVVGHIEAPTEAVERIMGWDPLSGSPTPKAPVEAILASSIPDLLAVDSVGALRALHLTAERGNTVSTADSSVDAAGRPRAVLFGVGHYARFALIPRVTRHVDLVCCHEVDPTQIGPIDRVPWEVRTSPLPEPDERYDVYFAAGYHHTHAPIAVEALHRNAYAVIEKPLATTRPDLDAVIDAATRHGRKVFVAYQRRFSAFNDFLRRDLLITEDAPVSMSALVYEVPLPRHHWYRWPASRGRIVCNGCHWIDYFLFLNGYRDVATIDANVAKNGDHTIQMTLDNGAVLSLILTEQGSPRLNMRDIVRVAVRDRHAVIVDQCRYEAESASRKLRRTRTRRADSFDRMYDSIARAVASGEPGDTIASLSVSGRAVLDAQDAVDAVSTRPRVAVSDPAFRNA